MTWTSEGLPEPIVDELEKLGPRDSCEMEQVMPDEGIELRWEDDVIVEAAELIAARAFWEARDLLEELTTRDLRCLDAHAHLGNLGFNSTWPRDLERARRSYAVGVAIGELTVGSDVDKLLPWSMIDNRPYLRCLKGLGLSEWRLGHVEAARDIFRRLMILNPMDNVGARFPWQAIEDGKSWEELS